MDAHNATNIPGGVVQIRDATRRDSDEISRLLAQLGHPTTPSEVEERWGEWQEEGNSALVAFDNGLQLLGFCQLHQTQVLHRPRPLGRITSLIVEEAQRGRGIGRALVAAAEKRLLSAGCGLLEITSNVRRVEAHAFYESLGYDKTSVRLAKDLRLKGVSR